jgi:hypothetical protein
LTELRGAQGYCLAAGPHVGWSLRSVGPFAGVGVHAAAQARIAVLRKLTRSMVAVKAHGGVPTSSELLLMDTLAVPVRCCCSCFCCL